MIHDEIIQANNLEAKIKHLKNIKRSFSVYRIDAGSCNGCEIEIFAAITPMWDPERFGFKLVASPRHADIIVVSGPVTRQMYYPLLRAYEAAPDPKIIVATGACSSTGGIFHDSYSVHGGLEGIIPIDVYVPGCPPHPASIIYGLAMGIGILEQKISKVDCKEEKELELDIEKSLIDNVFFEKELLALSKNLMSYLFGRKLYDKYIKALKTCSNPKNPDLAKDAIISEIKNESDPRYKECLGILHNDIYAKFISTNEEQLIDIDNIRWL